MLPWLGQLHLHDNTGEQDQHLAPGLGTFDFPGLFDYLRRNDCHPLITLEPHTRDDLWQALAYLEENDLLTGISTAAPPPIARSVLSRRRPPVCAVSP